jgi:hypothetical protein
MCKFQCRSISKQGNTTPSKLNSTVTNTNGSEMDEITKILKSDYKNDQCNKRGYK